MNPLRLQKLLRNAADPAYRRAVWQLRQRAERAADIEYTISGQERGGWTHYYYCHQDGVKLQFDWNRPGQHECPACGKAWSGEPYDGAWVTLAHSQLGTAMKDKAVCSWLDRDAEAARKVTDVLLAYSKVYEGYAVHGDIPYNGPGKLFAQTLDEAHWIIDLCYVYRFIEAQLEEEERQCIQSGLLRPCAEFLIRYKESQLHNHAVLITAAIGMLGFLLDDETIHQAGLAGPYGLRDQLERGVLEDGMWYEGNFQYHFYGYHSLLQYGILVGGTVWCLKEHPALKRMFDFPLRYILPDGTLPNMNDASYTLSVASLAPYYELAYSWYRDPMYGELLQLAYGMGGGIGSGVEEAQLGDETGFGCEGAGAVNVTGLGGDEPQVEKPAAKVRPQAAFAPAARDSLEALWFGEALPGNRVPPIGTTYGPYRASVSHEAGKPLSLEQAVGLDGQPVSASLAQLIASDAASHASGLTKLVNGSGWHVLVKHSTFGGEHDHMDRLGLSFRAGSVPLFVDPGTTAYGVPAHYGWFKHTYSHNTVSLNGKDQPPADGRLIQYRREPWGAWVESAVDWHREAGFRMKGSIILPPEMSPWDEAAYCGAGVRRINVLTEQVLLDIVRVSVPGEREIDLTYHMSGRLEEGEAHAWQPYTTPLSVLSQEWVQEKYSKRQERMETFLWHMKEGRLHQACWCSEPAELITALTPDNPPSGLRQTLVHRVQGSEQREVVFIHAFVYTTEGMDMTAAGAANREHSPAEGLKGLKLDVQAGEGGERLLRLSLADTTEIAWTLEWTDERAILKPA